MRYLVMNESDVEEITGYYIDYYNHHDGDCWTYEKAYRRIHQMVTIEDSLCLIQKDDESHTTGFAMGYFKEYDDITLYYLEEILIFADYQNKGYGKQFLHEIEKRILEHGADHLELTSVDDAHHMHFYKNFGMYEAANLKIMGKRYKY